VLQNQIAKTTHWMCHGQINRCFNSTFPEFPSFTTSSDPQFFFQGEVSSQALSIHLVVIQGFHFPLTKACLLDLRKSNLSSAPWACWSCGPSSLLSGSHLLRSLEIPLTESIRLCFYIFHTIARETHPTNNCDNEG
jgi:hypothetical protein